MVDQLIATLTVTAKTLDAKFVATLVSCFSTVGLSPDVLVTCEFEGGELIHRETLKITSNLQLAGLFAEPSTHNASVLLGFGHSPLAFAWTSHCSPGWRIERESCRIETRVSGCRYFYDERERDALLRLQHACDLLVNSAIGISEARLLDHWSDGSSSLFFRITQHERRVMDEGVLGVGYCSLHDCLLQWLQDPDCPIAPVPSKDPVPFPELSHFNVAPTVPIHVDLHHREFILRGKVGQKARMECCPCCGGVLPPPKYPGRYCQRSDAERTGAWLHAVKVRRLRDLDRVFGKPGGNLPRVKVEYRHHTPILMQRVYWDAAEDFAIIAKEYDDEHIVLNYARRL